MIVVFDTETTGVYVEKDRIVTAFVGVMDDSGEWAQKWEWLISPGVDIPQEATDVHGITTERAQAEGMTPAAAIHDIVVTLQSALAEHRVLSIYNAPFDLTLLGHECDRYGIERLVGNGSFVVDPLVIDKALDKYRRGSRKLVDVAPIYGVPVEENAHDAGADCLMTGRIALKMLEQWPEGVEQLHKRQVQWKREQAASFQEYLRRKDPNAVVSGEWPIIKG